MRAKVAKNFTLLIVAHGLMCAVLIPLFGLQVRYTFRSHDAEERHTFEIRIH